MPIRIAYFVSSAIEEIPSFRRMFLRCVSMVFAAMFSRSALSFTEHPSASNRNTCRSRVDRTEGPSESDRVFTITNVGPPGNSYAHTAPLRVKWP